MHFFVFIKNDRKIIFLSRKGMKNHFLSRKGTIMQAFSHFHRFTHAMYPHKMVII